MFDIDNFNDKYISLLAELLKQIKLMKLFEICLKRNGIRYLNKNHTLAQNYFIKRTQTLFFCFLSQTCTQMDLACFPILLHVF